MKKYNKLLTLCLTFALSFTLFGQQPEFITTNNIKKGKSIGIIDNKLYAYGKKDKVTRQPLVMVGEEGKVINSKPIALAINKNYYGPYDYKIINGELFAYYIIEDDKNNTPSLWMQKFDKDLNLLKEQKVCDLIGGTTKSSKVTFESFLGLGAIDNYDQDLLLDFNKKDGSYIVRYFFHTDKNEGLSYAKVIIVDAEFKVLNEFDFTATDIDHKIQFESLVSFDNGDIATTIFELKREDKRSRFNSLTKSSVMYLSKTGNEPIFLELMPSQQRIVGTAIGDKMSRDGKFSYAIASKDEDGNVLEVNLYRYNVNEDAIENEVFKFDASLSERNIVKGRGLGAEDMKRYSFDGFRTLEDGSVYFHLPYNFDYYTKQSYYNVDVGVIVVKINSKNELDWTSFLEKHSRVMSTSSLSGYFDYVDTEGNYCLLLNMNDTYYEKNKDLLAKKEVSPNGQAVMKPADYQNIRIAKFDALSGEGSLSTLRVDEYLGASVKLDNVVEVGDGLYYFTLWVTKNAALPAIFKVK